MREVKPIPTVARDVCNPRQLEFCRLVAGGVHQTEAYRRAGYSERGAHKHAHRLAANGGIQAAIREYRDERARRSQMTDDEVLRELAAVATFQVPDVADIDESGEVRIKPMADWPERAKRAIESIEATIDVSEDGVRRTLRAKVKAGSKLGALVELAKIHELHVERTKVDGISDLLGAYADAVKRADAALSAEDDASDD